MLSRITYTLRETYASFKRNVTLTVAAIITSAVSLLIFGLTLLIQHGFDNLLQRWEGGVEMIVFVNAGTEDSGLAYIREQLDQQVGTSIDSYTYCDVQCSLEDADRVLAGDPTTRQLLTRRDDPDAVQDRARPTAPTSCSSAASRRRTPRSRPCTTSRSPRSSST